MGLGNGYEGGGGGGGGCFAITVSEIGRTGEMGKVIIGAYTCP